MRAGAISDEYTATVAFFMPKPIPKTKRAANMPCHDWANPVPIGVTRRMSPLMKISPRRPNHELKGSENQQPMPPPERKMMELIAPTFHGSEPDCFAMPNSVGNDRLAALEPV